MFTDVRVSKKRILKIYAENMLISLSLSLSKMVAKDDPTIYCSHLVAEKSVLAGKNI